MARRRIFDPPRTFGSERIGLVVGILALVATAFYLSDYVINYGMAGL